MPQDKTLLAQKGGFRVFYTHLYKSRPISLNFIYILSLPNV